MGGNVTAHKNCYHGNLVAFSHAHCPGKWRNGKKLACVGLCHGGLSPHCLLLLCLHCFFFAFCFRHLYPPLFKLYSLHKGQVNKANSACAACPEWSIKFSPRLRTHTQILICKLTHTHSHTLADSSQGAKALTSGWRNE